MSGFREGCKLEAEQQGHSEQDWKQLSSLFPEVISAISKNVIIISVRTLYSNIDQVITLLGVITFLIRFI